MKYQSRTHKTAKNSDEFENLVSIISHDVRASTQALVDIPQWVLTDIDEAGIELPTDISENLEMLSRHAMRLDKMMLDLLTYSRVGRVQRVERINPSQIISRLLTLPGLTTGLSVTSYLPDCKILIDDGDITTLFQAVISNAVKHNDQPSGALEIDGDIEDGRLIIRFSDTGPGIEEKFHQKIFDMMTTLKPRDRVDGSGLGLAIAKKICDIYGGKIWVKSAPPKRGSQFGISLQLCD